VKLSIGISPCPNDTFIFDALINNKIDNEGLAISVVLEDVQTLNEWALQGRLDISKISYGVLPLLLNNYNLLSAGGALGKGVGPLLITQGSNGTTYNKVNDSTIAIPGKNTTAHLLFSMAYPHAQQKVFLVFNEIEEAVLKRSVHAGVIIHENRFTYLNKGLHKITDLGNYWEQQTNSPVPLGGIVIKKSIEETVQQKVNALIKKSVAYAFEHYPELSDYVRLYAQEMNEKVMRQHIDLYVNNYSLALGHDGLAAVNKLLEIYKTQNTGAVVPQLTLVK
jgi:1,4-dihydroxy-6-naphthoate synthase